MYNLEFVCHNASLETVLFQFEESSSQTIKLKVNKQKETRSQMKDSGYWLGYICIRNLSLKLSSFILHKDIFLAENILNLDLFLGLFFYA